MTHISGLVFQHVTMGPQTRRLQQLVDAVGYALLEVQVALLNLGGVIVDQHSPLKTPERPHVNHDQVDSVGLLDAVASAEVEIEVGNPVLVRP